MGSWIPVTCTEYEQLIEAHGGLAGLTVLAGRTDLGGERGDPIVVTVWGTKAELTPVCRGIRHPAAMAALGERPRPDREPCEHFRWDPEPRCTPECPASCSCGEALT